MLDNKFIVKYMSSRNCFLALSDANVKKLSYNKIVKVRYNSHELHFSCISSPLINDNNVVGFPSLFAKLVGIPEHETVFLNDVNRLPMLGQITISPLSFEDYEILESASSHVQGTMLDQIRVVNKNQKIVIWVSKWLHASVKVDDVDSLQAGVLATLTEVNITHPSTYNNNSTYTERITEDYAPQNQNSNSSSKMSKTTNQNLKNNLENIEYSNPDVTKLEKYIKLKKSTLYRVHPINLPENMNKCDYIAYQPFNIFIFKKDLPNFIKTENFDDIILCNMQKIEDPTVNREQNTEDNTEKSTNLVVRVCVIDEYFVRFSKNLKPCFSEKNTSRKFPVIFMSNKVMSSFGLSTGAKVSLGNSFPFQSNVVSVEVFSASKKTKNLLEKFRNYLIEQVKFEKCLLNSNICIEVEPNVFCSLRFNPETQFYLFDDPKWKGLKIYENFEKVVTQEKITNESTAIPGQQELEDIYYECDSFNKIINNVQKLLSLKNNENIFVVGKSGSGKSTISKIVCQNLMKGPTYTHVVYKSCKKLKGKSVENLIKLFAQEFENLVYYQPSILVLDDLHIICGKSESSSEVQTQESLYFNRVSEMLSELISTCQNNNQISVIATSESTMKINDNILSPRGKHLFKNVFTIPGLSKKEREQILHYLFNKKCQLDNNVTFENLGVKSEGLVVQDLVDFCTRSVFEAIKRDEKNNKTKPLVNEEDIETAYKSTLSLALKDIKLYSPDDKTFNDVGGLDDIKKTFMECMRWPAQYPKLFEDAPLRLQSGLLLYGPPGVGKTLLVGATANQCGLRMITIKGPELLSKYVGASEQAVRGIFEKAQTARPCILFFDEFDSLAPRRGHDSTGVTDRVVNQLLTQLDGVESLTGVFVIAATSRPDLLDPALLRPGRLDKQLLCGVPEQNARLAILKALSRNLVLAKEVDLKKLAASTKDFSGADLQAVLYTAQLFAVEEMLVAGKESDAEKVIIQQKHLDDALKSTRPSLTKQEVAKYDKIYAKFQGKKDENDVMIKKQRATLA